MKKKIFSILVIASLFVAIGLVPKNYQVAEATFTHRWSQWAFGGLGVPGAQFQITKDESGLWDNAPGSTDTGSRCGFLWVVANNGGQVSTPTEDEYVTYRTSDISLDPNGKELWVRFNLGNDARFKISVSYDTYGGPQTRTHIDTVDPDYTWRTEHSPMFALAYNVDSILITIDDYPNTAGTPKEHVMVLIDYIQIRDHSKVIWQENF